MESWRLVNLCMLKRLIEFYKIAHKPLVLNAEMHMHDVWRGITSVYHKPMTDALLSENESNLLQSLNTFAPNDGFHGVEMFEPLLYDDGENPRIMRVKKAGLKLLLPDCFGYHFSGPKNGMPHRLLPYAEALLVLIEKTGNLVPNHVLEIGAGIGYLGFLLSQVEAKSYTVIDLPSSCVFVAWFLAKCLGEHNVWLYGESQSERDEKYVRIFPSTDCAGVAHRKYDVVFNMNSFPEIPPIVQDQYLDIIASCLLPHGIFFSINHENSFWGQRSLHLAAQNHSNLERVSCQPESVIQNTGNPENVYVEEIYKLK